MIGDAERAKLDSLAVGEVLDVEDIENCGAMSSLYELACDRREPGDVTRSWRAHEPEMRHWLPHDLLCDIRQHGSLRPTVSARQLDIQGLLAQFQPPDAADRASGVAGRLCGRRPP